MNKLMMAVGAAALFGAVHADGIVSSDIVGYSTDSLTSGKYNLSGITFENIGETSSYDLNKLDIKNVTGGEDQTTADFIQIWNPATSGYTTFYYYYEEEYKDEAGWYDAGGDEEPILDSGMAFWYRARAKSDKAITVAGSIDTVDDATVVLTSGKYNLVVNPFPAAIDLNDKTTVEVKNVTGGEDQNSADFVQIWNPTTSGYTTFYYYYEEEYKDEAGWYDAGGDEEPTFPAGTAFWYRARAGENKSLVFPNPTK